MVAALPEVELKQFSHYNMAELEGLEEAWFNIIHKKFIADPNLYTFELKLAQRKGTLSVVQEIIYDKERERENVK